MSDNTRLADATVYAAALSATIISTNNPQLALKAAALAVKEFRKL